MSDERAMAVKISPIVRDFGADAVSDDALLALGAFFEKWGYGAFEAKRFKEDFAASPYGVVLVKDEVLLGALLYRIAGDEAEIIELAVHADHRRASIGRHLLACLSSHLSEHNILRLLLEVAEDNHGAIALYASAGFERKGVRPRYYQRYDEDHKAKKIDAIIMELWLSKG